MRRSTAGREALSSATETDEGKWLAPDCLVFGGLPRPLMDFATGKGDERGPGEPEFT